MQEVIERFGFDDITYNFKRNKDDSLDANVKPGWIKGGKLTISDNLIAILTQNEIELVIAHEMSHLYNKDVRLRKIILFILWVSLTLCVDILTSLNISCVVTLFLAIIIYLLIINPSISKIIEIRADIQAALWLQNIDSLISALNKINVYKKNHNNIKQSKKALIFIISLINPHIPIDERIKYLKYLQDKKIRAIDDPRRPSCIKILTQIWKLVRAYVRNPLSIPTGDKLEYLDYAIFIYYSKLLKTCS